MTWNFPDYSSSCPLCGGENCAVRIGFYKRKKVIVDNKIYENVPIARWLCQRKGSRIPLHQTFSLLPSPLIPYHRHGLNVIVDTVNFYHHHGSSFEKTKNFISSNGVDTDISLENNHIHDFMNIFSQALLKLTTIAELKQQISQASYWDSSDPIGTMLKFIDGYQSCCSTTQQLHASKAEQLALDFFYHFQSDNYFQRHFLFGTPSQKLAA
jgi:hypothetical protein